MTDANNKQRQLAIKIATSANEVERDALLRWANDLLDIKQRKLSPRQKAKEAILITTRSKIVIPAAKLIGREMKRLAWDERSKKGRFGLIGVGIGVTIFGGQGAGIAALGTAVGVPLWVVLGAGGAFIGMLIEELTTNPEKTNQDLKTSYSVIEAEKKENQK